MVKVLFVCLGNICRSPAAEGIFQSFVESRKMNDNIQVDSAGTSSYHQGEKADERMREHAEKRGYTLLSRSRGFTPKDFDDFDLIIVMDQQNYKDVTALAKDKRDRNKVSFMTDYLQGRNESFVPDPYYQGAEGFEKVLDILENASEGLLRNIEKNLVGPYRAKT